MTRRAAFESVGGFDETFAIGFNDTDFCLRLRAAGLRVLYDGHTMLYHHESATRSTTKQVFHPEDTARLLDRWAGLLRDGDPFYSPLLSDKTQDHVLREDDGCRVAHTPRVTSLRDETRQG
ncbi:MAG: glycosyltransferase family 2 protein, partial [Janthinobacterium lividum]